MPREEKLISYRKNAQRNRQWARELIIEARKVGCLHCGQLHPATLDFHHKDPKTKKFNLTTGKTRSRKSIIEELQKCIVLCSNCHRILHWKN